MLNTYDRYMTDGRQGWSGSDTKRACIDLLKESQKYSKNELNLCMTSLNTAVGNALSVSSSNPSPEKPHRSKVNLLPVTGAKLLFYQGRIAIRPSTPEK